MVSCYAATDEELESIHMYRYFTYYGAYREEADAAQTFTLS